MHTSRYLLLLSIFLISAPAHAVTYIVGSCSGATHSDFATAYIELGTTSGPPHLLRLCPGVHSTGPVSAAWAHAGITIESVDGNAAGTELRATGGTLMTTTHQHFTIRNLGLTGNFDLGNTGNGFRFDGVVLSGSVQALGSNLFIDDSEINGDLTTRGRIFLTDSGVSGNLLSQNGIISEGSDITGDIRATNGGITLTDGSIAGQIDTGGNSQPITLTGISMSSGSIDTAGAIITINNSQIGSADNSVPISAHNGITVNDSEIWGDLTARTWAPIFLNPATTVFGNCTPEPTGGGTCGTAASCSSFIGQATINELRRSGGGQDAFIEVRILDLSIPESVWSTWTLRYCSARTGVCRDNTLGSAVVDGGGYPWLLLTEAGMVNSNDISLGTPGGGIEVRLDDADGRPIDYLSVAGHQAGLAEDCPYPYDTTMTGSNSFGIMRLPDGIGDWMTGGPGNSGGNPTPGAPNDGVMPRLPVLEILMEQPSWSGTPGEVLDTSGRGFHGTAEGSTNTAVTDPALPGNPGTCRYGEFDGIDSGIFVGNEIDYDFGNELTVMAWVRWNVDPGSVPVESRWANIVTSNATTGSGDNGQFWLQHSQFNDAFEIAVQTNQERRFLLSTTQPQQGEWYHVAGVWDGNTSRLRIYVNGVEEGNRSLFGASVASESGNATHIGRWSRPTFRRFRGNIDEVRVFNQALDADDVQEWMNTRRPCEEQPLNHIRLEHSGAGLTCQAESITVRACADEACSEEFNEEITVQLTSPTGNWSPGSLTFTGQATVGLQVTEPGAVVLDAVSNPAAPVRCFVGAVESCAMDWAEAGFLIEVDDHVSATTGNGIIRAVRSNDEAQACVPAFGDVSRNVDFWSRYVNPVNGTLGVSVNGVGIAGAEPGTPVMLDFNSDGAAEFGVIYPDVGKMRLHARYLGNEEDEQEAGLEMIGQGDFVVRPAGFGLEALGNPGASSAVGPVFRAAGEPFELVVSALNATGGVTPNFGRENPPESVALDLELVAPAGGAAPGLTGNLGSFGTSCGNHAGQPGTACGDEFRFGEVGIIALTPRLSSGSYLGTADVVGERSGNIGRFIPSHFHLSGATLTDRADLEDCSDDFTYLGEWMEAEFSLVARSVSDALTTNYTGDFARLAVGQLGLSTSADSEFAGTSITWDEGIGLVETLLQGRRDPSGDRGPHDPFEVRIEPVDSDGVVLDGDNLIGTTRLLFGRMVIDNAIGSELGPLDLPWRVEVWDNSTWRVNTEDSCTYLNLAEHVALANGHGTEVQAPGPIAVGASGETAVNSPDSVLTADQGRGHVRLNAPLVPGWVEVQLGLDNRWSFLRDDLSDSGDFDDNPAATANWGLFEGSPNRIILREVIPR
ncbi:MAG: DUF6701 domain-containing protein [Wenzhouxiangella sp.]